MFTRLAASLRAMLRRGAFEDAMDAEMRFHLDSRIADLIQRGVPPETAARRARVEFGSVEKAKDHARETVGLRLVDETVGDVRYALRTFRRNKAFAATAVITLALGIGANTAIFSVIDALLLRWLPVRDPQQLLELTVQSPGARVANDTFSYPMVRALDEHRDVFEGVMGFSATTLEVGPPGAVARVPAEIVTGAYYDTLGLTPVIGRLLTRTDDTPDAPMVAVLSYGYWERQFALSPQTVGQTLLIAGAPATIIGVSPRGFVGATVGSVADVTVSVSSAPKFSQFGRALVGPGTVWLRALARPRVHLSLAETRARLAAVWPRTAAAVVSPTWPVSVKNSFTEATLVAQPGGTGWTFLRNMYTRPLTILMGAVILVLLVACANVASLLLARASARRREVAVRLAIGARRGRILRQLLIESLVLGGAGAIAGVGLAWLSSTALVDTFSSGRMHVTFDLAPNGHILVFAAVVAVATALLFGVAPAFVSAGLAPASVLQDDARSGSQRTRLLPSLVAVQVALSLVLLAGAGLFVRTLRNLRSIDPGFQAQGVLLVEIDGRAASMPPSILDSVRALPGVASASVSTHTPMSGSTWSEAAVPAGRPLPETDTALFVGVSPGFFAALQTPIMAGRAFTETDSRQSVPVAIINEQYARRYFPGTNPLGQHVTASGRNNKHDLQIVGVAANTASRGLRTPPPPIVYVPYAQLTGDVPATIEIRATLPASALASELRRIVQPLQPNAPVEVTSLAAQVDSTLVQERVMALLGSGFGLLALVLASVGIYGLLAYGVALRGKEIGIRVALGATRRGVIALLMKAAYGPLVAGLALGLLCAWPAARAVQSLLFGLTSVDPVTFGGAIAALVIVAHVAAYVPARRAATADPLTALRQE